MKLYRFSPIQNNDQLLEAVKYVAGEVADLSKMIVGNAYPISYLTIFAHYQEEYNNLINNLSELGKVTEANNGMKVILNEPIEKISQLRIRKPDPYRMQVGCADLDVGDYEEFKKNYLNKSEGLRLIERPDYEMIEFFDPDTDVLSYVVSN